MLSLEESLKILKETNALLEGHFILSSGLHSPQYVQCAKLLSKPEDSMKCPSSKALVSFKIFKDSSNESIFFLFVSNNFKFQFTLFYLTYQVCKIFQIFNLKIK